MFGSGKPRRLPTFALHDDDTELVAVEFVTISQLPSSSTKPSSSHRGDE
jgi:hypothetical protein